MSTALETALLANRSRYNARFAEARHYQPRLDGDVFGRLLQSLAAPAAEAVAVAAPTALDAAVEALYDTCLDLLAHDLLGPAARSPWIAAGWEKLLPRLAGHLAADPRTVIGAVSNALYNLAATPGARPDQWLADMDRLAGAAPDLGSLLKAGQVCAWRAGLAQYRAGALAACRALPPAAACLALGLPPQGEKWLEAVLGRLEADPWYRPENGAPAEPGLRLVARTGAFRGFGGLFIAPPIVEPADNGFLVTDGEGVWLLIADAFGATFHRSAGLEAAPAQSLFSLDKKGRVSLGPLKADFPELGGATSWAVSASTLAVTVPYSHAVYLVARA